MANPIGMDRPILAAAATLSLLLSVGCGARPDWVTAPQPLSGPVALNSHMVWVSSAREEILVVDAPIRNGQPAKALALWLTVQVLRVR